MQKAVRAQGFLHTGMLADIPAQRNASRFEMDPRGGFRREWGFWTSLVKLC